LGRAAVNQSGLAIEVFPLKIENPPEALVVFVGFTALHKN